LSGLHFKFLNAVRVRDGNATTLCIRALVVGCRETIDQEVVIVRPLAVHEGRRGTQNRRDAAVAAAEIARIGDAGRYARRQTNELGIVPRNQRQAFYYALVGDPPQCV
jgi:hypothetical protein